MGQSPEVPAKGPGGGGDHESNSGRNGNPQDSVGGKGVGAGEGPYQAPAALGFGPAGTCLLHPETGSRQLMRAEEVKAGFPLSNMAEGRRG